MGDIEAPQFTSLQSRIAALNKQHVINNAPLHQQQNRPLIDSRSKSVNNPSIASFGSSVIKQGNNEPIGVRNVLPPPITKYTTIQPARPPPLPQRTQSQSPSLSLTNGAFKSSPALPPRSPHPTSQQQLVRRDSNESIASITSNISSISALSLGPAIPSRRPSTDVGRTDAGGRLRGLPPPLAEANLPPLPPSRQLEKEQPAKPGKNVASNNTRPPPVMAKSMPQIPSMKAVSSPPPSLPPRTPSLRPQVPPRVNISSTKLEVERSPGLPPRSTSTKESLEPLPTARTDRKLPPPFPQRSALSWSMNKPTTDEDTKSIPDPVARPDSDAPPVVPRASRPTNFEIEQILKAETLPPDNCCLRCRDFSASDQVAAQYPRESVTNLTTQYLAEVLCRPFASHTDKARAIFAWLHYNIAYDTVAFFGNNVQHATPETTLARGLAVCGGYAGLFTTIATKGGLESLVISGHGKGINYTSLKPGEKIPPYSAGHAWNAVRIDGGEWKLIDPCWGAGHIAGGTQNYNKSFNPLEFTKSNEDFGLTHFPSNESHFFRNDGVIPTWEEYFIGPGPIGVQPLQIFGQPGKDHGIDRESFEPQQKAIDVSHSNPNDHTRFQFSKVCPHWDHERHGPGKPYLMGLFINGIDGRGFKRGQEKEDFTILESNDFFTWADIQTRLLGTAGQKVKLAAITTVNGKDARGMSIREYKASKGVYGMSYSFVAEWELA